MKKEGELVSKAILKGCMSPELSLVNKLPNGSKIQLETKYSYNVQYSKELTCRGELTAKVTDKEKPEQFCINVKMIGIFSFEDGADKDMLHIETFRLLFPFVRALVSTLTVNAGIPAVILPNIDIEGQNIYRIGNI